MNGNLSVSVSDYFERTRNQFNYNARSSIEGKAIKSTRKTTAYSESDNNFHLKTNSTKALKEYLFRKY